MILCKLCAYAGIWFHIQIECSEWPVSTITLNAILPVLQKENDFDVTTEESGSGLRSDKRSSESQDSDGNDG